MDYFYAQLRGAALHQQIAALHRDRREKDTIGQILQVIEIAANPYFAFYPFIVRRQIAIVNRPVLARSVVIFASKIALAIAPGDCIPKHGLAADASRALGVEAGFAGLHGGDVAAGKLERHRVGVEVGVGVDLRSAFDQSHVDAAPGKMSGKRATRRARSDNHDIICFR